MQYHVVIGQKHPAHKSIDMLYKILWVKQRGNIR